jgi:Skp family chaperone for outer membrane proteins
MATLSNFMSKFGGQGEDSAPPDSTLLSAGAPNALAGFLDQFTTLTESYFFYNNTVELRFNVADHKYYKVDPELGNLIEQRGVTKTVHIIDRSPALVPWASKKCAEKILRTVPLSTTKDEFGSILLAPITLEDFTKLVLEAKGAHKEILEEAGDIGHMAHKCLEDSIQHAIDHNGGVVTGLLYLPENEKACNAVRAAFSWMIRHHVRWIKTEQKIYSKEHEYAGTMDGTAWTSSCDDPSCCDQAHRFVDHRSLIDWKSSNYLYIEYLYQTAAYQQAETEEYGLEFDDRWILRLGKNEEEAGKFEPWYLDSSTFAEDFAGFLACLNLTKLVEQVTERISVQKKGVRAAKKLQREAQKALDKAEAKAKRAQEKAQLKLDRAAEKERIKADAKRAREEAKQNVGRPKPDNEVPRQTEDTPNATMEKAVEPVAVVQLPVSLAEERVEPYVIPEEA